MAIGIPHAGKNVIFIPSFGCTAFFDAFGQLGMVAAVEKDALAIGAEDHAVQPVLTTACHGVQLLCLIVLVVAIGISQTE